MTSEQLLVPLSLTFEEEEAIEELLDAQEILAQSGFSYRQASEHAIEVLAKPS